MRVRCAEGLRPSVVVSSDCIQRPLYRAQPRQCLTSGACTCRRPRFSRASVKSPRRLEATRSEQAYREPAKATEDVPGFELIKIPGTGSCLFQSIAQCNYYLSEGKLLTGRQLSESGFELRRAVCFMLDKHRVDLEPFIAGDFDAYLHHMAVEGVWGGEPELAMAAKVTKRPILVYKTSGSSIFSKKLAKASQYGIDDYQNVPPICILFGDYHYDSLLAKL